MNKLLARLWFSALPAILAGTIVGLLTSTVMGVIVFVGMFWLGLDMTAPRPERGESR